MTPEANDALSKAKIYLMAKPDSVFFTHVCFSLKHVWNDKIKTADTNGVEVRYNPKFFMALSQEERVFLLLHETLHVALLHNVRLQKRDHAKWNVAADYVINLVLTERGYKMPSMGLLDSQYKGMTTEEVYALLPDQDPEEIDMDIRPGEKSDEDIQSDVADILIRASVAAKMAGESPGLMPGEIQIFLDGLLNPKLSWKQILQKYLYAQAKNDYSFRKPNRRFFPKHILPSLFSEKLMDLAIAVDTSGSVSDTDFHVFISEVASIFKMMKPEKITLIQFDTHIKGIEEIHNFQELKKVKFIGRGGTVITPVIAWANENKPGLLLVFSDGYFNKPTIKTKTPTLWLIHNNPTFVPAFGKHIPYEIK